MPSIPETILENYGTYEGLREGLASPSTKIANETFDQFLQVLFDLYKRGQIRNEHIQDVLTLLADFKLSDLD